MGQGFVEDGASILPRIWAIACLGATLHNWDTRTKPERDASNLMDRASVNPIGHIFHVDVANPTEECSLIDLDQSMSRAQDDDFW